MIELELNGVPLEVEVDPAERLLDLLRYRLGLTGTKEGCGEGECGACTVYLDGLPVDACLVPAYQAAGREVRTIESLDDSDLLPFLRTGATQCGACTPGVVMTGTWIRDHPELAASHSIRELMAGNLCRCTGYDGIIEGVEAALAAGRSRRGARPGDRGAPRPLPSAAVRGTGRILRPASLGEALTLRHEHPAALPIAGATDLFVHWPGHLEAHDESYLDLSRLEELRAHEWTPEALVLGGLTTYWDIVRDPRATASLPLLVEAARQIGAIQIQARGTWAGNIANASPAADGVPVLMAYDAIVVLASTAGEREVPLADFYLDYKRTRMSPDELIVAVRVPLRAYERQWFDKVGPRAAQAITKVGLAVTRRAEDGGGGESRWRVVANSVAPTVRRCPATEARLETGEPLDGPEELEAVLAEDVAPIDDVRSTAAYRQQVLARLLYFGLMERGGIA